MDDDSSAYEGAVLAELRAINGKLDMLAIIDQKLKAPKRPMNLFSVLGLQEVSPKFRVALLVLASLMLFGYREEVQSLLGILR